MMKYFLNSNDSESISCYNELKKSIRNNDSAEESEVSSGDEGIMTMIFQRMIQQLMLVEVRI